MARNQPLDDYWKQFRSEEEKRQDELDEMAEYWDSQDDERACRYCGSVRFERNGDIERCADCGR